MDETTPTAPPADASRITVSVCGETLDVLWLDGREHLNEPLELEVDVDAPGRRWLDGVLGSRAVVRLVGADGHGRVLGGTVVKYAERGEMGAGRVRARLAIAGALWRLGGVRDWRVLLGHDIEGMVRDVLARHGLEGAVEFRLSRVYPVHPWVCQLDESDLGFLQRQLARHGLFAWSLWDGEGAETVVMGDQAGACPYLARGAVRLVAPGGFGWPGPGLTGLRHRARLVPGEYAVAGLGDGHRRVEGDAASRAPGACGRFELFGGGGDADEVQRLAEDAAAAAAAQAHSLVLEGHLADLAVGHVVSLAGSGREETDGDWLIIAIDHEARRAGAGEEPALLYRHTAVAVPRSRGWRPVVPAPRELPLLISARIEADGPYARLDEAGRYRIRALFDAAGRPHGEASPPLPRLAPHGGPVGPSGRACGFHAPLCDGAEVLISPLAHDPDRFMVVGGLYDGDHVSPVTSANRSQHVYRSASGHTLLMDDAQDAPVIRLHTDGEYNVLVLDAGAHARLMLAAERGALVQRAGGDHRVEAGGDLDERVGGSRHQQADGAHHTRTRDGALHQQSGAGVKWRAAHSVKLAAGERIALKAGQDVELVAGDGQTVTVRGDGHIDVRDGELVVDTAGDLVIEGDGRGELIFEQAGGGVRISPRGEVSVYGHLVGLEGAESIEFRGPVEKIITAPAPPAPAPAPVTGDLGDIPDIVDPEAPRVTALGWSRRRLRPGDPVEQQFSIHNVSPGARGTVRIYECSAGRRGECIEERAVTFEDGAGVYALPWTRTPEDLEGDLARQEEAGGPDAPLYYRYTVELEGGQGESALSQELLMPTTYEVQVFHGHRRHRAWAEEDYVLLKNGEVVGRGRTDAEGWAHVRCADPAAEYEVRVAGRVYRLSLEEEAGA